MKCAKCKNSGDGIQYSHLLRKKVCHKCHLRKSVQMRISSDDKFGVVYIGANGIIAGVDYD